MLLLFFFGGGGTTFGGLLVSELYDITYRSCYKQKSFIIKPVVYS